MGHHGLLYECLPWAPRCFSWSHSACLASAPHSNFYKSDHVILLLQTFQRLHITFKIKSRPHLKRSLCSGLCCLSRFLSFCACPGWLCTSGLSLFLDQVVFFLWVFALAEPSLERSWNYTESLLGEAFLDYWGSRRNPKYHLQSSPTLLPYLISFGWFAVSWACLLVFLPLQNVSSECRDCFVPFWIPCASSSTWLMVVPILVVGPTPWPCVPMHTLMGAFQLSYLELQCKVLLTESFLG